MFNKLKKICVALMVTVLIIGVVQVQNVFADENTEGTITHNLNINQVPFIYCYIIGKPAVKLTAGQTTIPKGTYNIAMYVKSTNIAVDKQKSTILINGIENSKLTWTTENEGYYTKLSFYVDQTKDNVVEAKFNYDFVREFSVRTRKIITENPNANEMEKILNENPSTYLLYNEDNSVRLEGTINTAISSYTNFVHWKQIKGEQQYITTDDTYVRNLPNGEYTVIETDSGKGLKTKNQGSSSVWLNASLMKEVNGNKYYTFTVNDELVNEWMNECVNNSQANSLFFGFYLENLKTSFDVMYDGNGHNQGLMRNHTGVKAGEKITLNDNQFIRYGYTFMGWNTVKNPTPENPGVAYSNQAELTVNENTILYAQWRKNINIEHSVFIQDKTKDNELTLIDSKTLDTEKLAYSNSDLENLLSQNIQKGYKYIDTIIEVKNANSQVWEVYQPGTSLQDQSQVRYVLSIDKDLKETKTISYTVEYWIEGANTPIDSQTISEEVWIHEEDTNLKVKEIVIHEYEGYEFSYYNPETLPEMIENNGIIKVYYKKIQVPVIPEEPTNPEEPNIPIVPPTPIIPVIPNAPIIPIVTPPVADVDNNVNVPIEDNRVPLGDADDTTDIEDADIPLASNPIKDSGSWALINLICVFVTLLVGLLVVMLKHKKDETEDNTNLEQNKEIKTEYRRRWTKVLAVIIAITSIIVFILTENITLPMILIDKWTVLMLVLVVVQVIVYLVTRQNKSNKQDKEPNVVTA